jgi:DNA (cytosine-5)-methyltransferase 1
MNRKDTKDAEKRGEREKNGYYNKRDHSRFCLLVSMNFMTHQEKERPIAVDLFAGAGGMTLGFEQAGFDVLASVEIDPIHCAIHQFNFPFWSVLCKNIIDTTGEEIRNCSSIGSREIDVVFGGPPCQGLSLIGKRVLDDPRNSLVFHFIRLVLELQPKFFRYGKCCRNG